MYLPIRSPSMVLPFPSIVFVDRHHQHTFLPNGSPMLCAGDRGINKISAEHYGMASEHRQNHNIVLAAHSLMNGGCVGQFYMTHFFHPVFGNPIL